jgi:hypothetical protein
MDEFPPHSAFARLGVSKAAGRTADPKALQDPQ